LQARAQAPADSFKHLFPYSVGVAGLDGAAAEGRCAWGSYFVWYAQWLCCGTLGLGGLGEVAVQASCPGVMKALQ